MFSEWTPLQTTTAERPLLTTGVPPSFTKETDLYCNHPAPKVLEHLRDVQQIKPNEWQALCPIHEADGKPHKPSLSITLATDGKALLCCHVCKDAAPAKRIVEACGLKLSDLSPTSLPDRSSAKSSRSQRGKFDVVYDYVDELGQLLFQVVRMVPKDFRQRRPDPAAPGKWLWKLDGVRPVPYRLPQLLAADANEIVVLCEGEKDCDRLAALGMVTTTNAGGAGKWLSELSEILRGRRVVVILDNDAAGESHGQIVARSLFGVASSVALLRLPGLPPKGDVSDWLDAGGTAEQLHEQFDLAELWTPESEHPLEPDPSDRVTIVVTTEEHLVTDQVVAALADKGPFYCRANQLVRVLSEGTPELTSDGIARPVEAARIRPAKPVLRDELSRRIRFVRLRESEEESRQADCHPPLWCLEAVANREVWPGIPRLQGIVTCPVMRADGTILTQPGYDPASELYLDYRGQPLELPEQPTQDDARNAARYLMELVSEFPFGSELARAAWLACVLSPLARHGYSGPTPLFLIDANTRGSGKTLLADVAGMIFTGSTTPRMSAPNDDDEFRKRITALARSGDAVVLIDNVSGTLGCPSFDSALTSTRWKDRILGVSETAEFPLSIVWIATGNNVAIVADTSRRTCHIRLESPEEKPEERSGFRHPRILDHVRNNLHTYRAAALTILAAYVRAGRPPMGLRHWGSFEGWSDLVRNAVVYAGLPDPGDTRQALAERCDTQANALRALFHLWPSIDPDGKGLGAAEILRLANDTEHPSIRETLVELCDTPADELPTPKSLGKRLGKLAGTVVTGRHLTCRDVHGTKTWRVAEVRSGGGFGGCSGFADPQAGIEIEGPEMTSGAIDDV